MPTGLLSAATLQIAGSLARLAALVLAGRFLAHQLGASGLAAFGQIQNLALLAGALGVQALQAGFQRGSAVEEASARTAWLQTGIALGIGLALASGMLVWLCLWAGLIALPASVGKSMAFALVLSLPASVVVGAHTGEAMGRGHWKRIAGWTTLSGVVQSLVWVAAVSRFGLEGLAWAIVLQPLYLWALSNLVFPSLGTPVWPPDRNILRLWLPYLVAGAIPSLAGPISSLFLRLLMLRHGWEMAGQWQAAVRIPELVFPLWNGAVGAWVITRTSSDRGRLPPSSVFQGLAGTTFLSGVLWIGAPWVLSLAWGSGFDAALWPFRLQLVAEVPRTAAWILSCALLGRGCAKEAISMEVVGFVVLCLGAWILEPKLGLLASPVASFLDNLITAGLAVFLWRRSSRHLGI